jgi:hypothetical protein
MHVKRRLLVLSASLLVLFSLLGLFPHSRVGANPAIGSMTKTLYSVADSYVNSSNPDDNYGAVPSIDVGGKSTEQYAYVMFDISSLSSEAHIISAQLKVCLKTTTGAVYAMPADSIGAHYCSDNSWTELGITWNNKPSFAPTPSDTWFFPFLYTPDTYKSWDITGDVGTALASTKITEVLKFERKTGDGCAVFVSREGGSRPKLEVEYVTGPISTVHFESVQDMGATANLGFVTFAESPFQLPIDADAVNGNYTAVYSGGYAFVRWETTGGITVSDENAESTVVTVSGNGTLRAVGSISRLEYAYDHMTPTWGNEESGYIDAVRFTPLSSGHLLEARYYIYAISSYSSNTFAVHVMDNDRKDLIPPFNVTPTSEGWLDVNLSTYDLNVVRGEDFYLGMEWLVYYNPGLGSDWSDPSQRSCQWNKTVWKEETNTDFMIRAVVAGPPEIHVLSPKNEAYAATSILLSFTVDRTTQWTGYSLDGQANVTISGNTTLSLSEGSHWIRVFANCSYGTGCSGNVSFTADITPPTLDTPSRTPQGDVDSNREVKISVNATDPLNKVKNVTLSYNLNNSSTWTDLLMTPGPTTDLYEGTIPGQEASTHVKYKITAYDGAGNYKVENNAGSYYAYLVIPEFPSFLILPLFFIATLLAVTMYRRKTGMSDVVRDE